MCYRSLRHPARRLALVALTVAASVGAIGLSPSAAGAAVVVGPPTPTRPANPCGPGLIDMPCSVTTLSFTHHMGRSLGLGSYFPGAPESLSGKLSARYDLSCADGTHATATLVAGDEGGQGPQVLSNSVALLQAVPGSTAVTSCVVSQTIRGTWVTVTENDALTNTDLVGFQNYPPIYYPWL